MPAGHTWTILAVWLLLAVALYVVWWALISLSLPGVRPKNLLTSFTTGAPYYLPIIMLAMALPAVLQLLWGRLAWLWSSLFLLGSIVLPVIRLTQLRAYYIEETARGLHVEGKGLWGAFAFVELVGLYGAVCALTFALSLMRGSLVTRARLAHLLFSLAAISLLLHVSVSASAFRPFFAWVYK